MAPEGATIKLMINEQVLQLYPCRSCCFSAYHRSQLCCPLVQLYPVGRVSRPVLVEQSLVAGELEPVVAELARLQLCQVLFFLRACMLPEPR